MPARKIQLRVFVADALGDGFELLGHVVHVIVVAAGDDWGAGHVAAAQYLGGQQDRPRFELAAKEPPHGFTPFKRLTASS